MQRVPPVFNNGVRLGKKIPIAGRRAIPLNGTDSSEQHCGSTAFLLVRGPRFSREGGADHLYHQMPQ